MDLNDYLNIAKIRQAQFARSVGASPQLMYYWANGIRPIPIHHCVAIERATGGQVTRQELRPDDWWKIWPELAQMQGAAAATARAGLETDAAGQGAAAAAAAANKANKEN